MKSESSKPFLLFKRLVFVSSVLFALPSLAGPIYQVDDGSGESSLAAGITEPHAWLNAFQIVAGGEKITSLDISFGQTEAPGNSGNGAPITAVIWSDPTNDGNPTDAVVVASVAGVTANVDTDIFNTFVLATQPTFNVGDWFFAGFVRAANVGPGAGFDVSRDTSSPDNLASWIFCNCGGPDGSIQTPIGPIGQGYSPTSLVNIGLGGNFLIRANSESGGAVPAPATLALFGLGLAGLGAVRSKRSAA